jgi:hypothetical protein
MLWRDKIDVMDIPNILKFDVPFTQLLWCQVLAVSFVCYIVILAKYASKIAPRKEDATGAMVPLNAWF